VAALGDFIEMNEIVVGALGPTPRSLVDLLREDAHGSEVVDPDLETAYADPGTSLRIDWQGRPWVSYHRGSMLVCAHASAGNWILEDIEDGLGPSGSTSLALDAQDRPCILFSNASTRELRYTTKQSGQWLTEVPDGGLVSTYGLSLVLDAAGNAHVSYRNDGSLEYAMRATNGVWDNTVIDTRENSGVYTSIALNPAGLVEIAFKFKARYSGPGALRYATAQLASTGIEDVGIASSLWLQPPTPNPSVDGRVSLAFSLPRTETVTLELYDVAGRQVAMRPSEVLEAGFHQMTWDASLQASGLYFVRLSTAEGSSTQRWTILRR
jgi:hypothetical protein